MRRTRPRLSARRGAARRRRAAARSPSKPASAGRSQRRWSARWCNTSPTATDRLTGLTRQRYPVGTALDDGGTPAFPADDHCQPAATQAFTWGDALLAAQQLNAAGGIGGFTGWRVPNRKELLSIVETRRTTPAINAAVSPDTPHGAFFTSTPYSATPSCAWATDFLSGGELSQPKSTALYLRLVR